MSGREVPLTMTLDYALGTVQQHLTERGEREYAAVVRQAREIVALANTAGAEAGDLVRLLRERSFNHNDDAGESLAVSLVLGRLDRLAGRSR